MFKVADHITAEDLLEAETGISRALAEKIAEFLNDPNLSDEAKNVLFMAAVSIGESFDVCNIGPQEIEFYTCAAELMDLEDRAAARRTSKHGGWQ
jgi:hypothetical protein